LRVPDDFGFISSLLSVHRTDSNTPADVEKAWRSFPADGVRLQLIAEADDGEPAGYGFARRYPEEMAGRMVVHVLVPPGARGHGVGGALLAAVERFAAENGAAFLDSDVRDENPAALDWARRRGYEILDHVFESTLSLAGFDESRFTRPEGIRFFTLADSPGEATERQAYEVERAAAPDNPLYALDAFPSFEAWRADWSGRPAECLVLAADGDRIVGTTLLELMPEEGAAYTGFTGVARDCRGRGVALGLKLHSFRVARQFGLLTMKTNNHADNEPILAVNRKLGYVKTAGFYGLRKRLP
jgi:GNAT superfamily N-acetyltransferase